MNTAILITAIVSGIGVGSAYSLLALSFTSIVATTSYFHIGVASLVMIGTVVSYLAIVSWGISSAIIVVLLVMLVTALLGLVSYAIAVWPFQGRLADARGVVLVATLGFGLALESAVGLTFGTTPRRVPAFVSESPIEIGPVLIRPIYLVMFAALVVAGFALELFLRRTETGRVLRALQEEPVGVELLGVNVRRITIGIFLFAGAMAGLAGFLIAPLSQASPAVSHNLLLYGFAAMAIGGFGSFPGAIVGGVITGITLQVATALFNPAAGDLAVVALLLLVLIALPDGLLGQGRLRSV